MKSAFKFCLTLFVALALCFQDASSGCATTAVKEPEETRLKAILGEFEDYAVKGMVDWQIPGMALAIVQGDDIIYEKAFGVKELGKDDPVTTDTVFQIGSASKAFTAALVAMLVDEGKIKWDDKVINHLSGFKMYDPWVTDQFQVTNLMAQNSGMPAFSLDNLIMAGYGRDKVVDSLRYVKPVTSFRSTYAYQNSIWLVAAKLVEKYTGKTWEQNIKDRIFTPLGMTSSSCDKSSYVSSDNAASLHHIVDGKIIVLPMDWKYMDWPYDYGPAGGINSNVKDMIKWIRMQMSDGVFEGKRIIKEENLRFMRKPKTAIGGSTGPEQYYCQGWIRREFSPYPIIWHNGGTSGSKTMVAFVSEARVGIVVLSNLIENKFPEALAFRFFDLYFGNPARDWSKEALRKQREASEKENAKKPKRPAIPLHARPEYKYEGDYSNDVYGKVTVRKSEDHLVLSIGPRSMELDLRHWDKDTFMSSWSYFTVTEDAGLVTFTAGPDGEVSGMVVDVLNEDGCGVFRKISADGKEVPAATTVSTRPSAPSTFDKIFSEVLEKDGIRAISYLQMMQICFSRQNVVIVDVLSSDDYRTGHIPSAISFPVKTISESSAKEKIPPGSNVVVYCLDFHCPYSDEAAKKLSSYGYRVLVFKGGLDEWQEKGQKLER
ncbi:MAG: serine hydrolase [Candidatus Omnitrophica bacterium]|nr:serine hydrolase [Candidatus Omnitrophota bacterium]MCM8791290.1 serine hydrolase [Candidatus Omnitrophota bacterium]